MWGNGDCSGFGQGGRWIEPGKGFLWGQFHPDFIKLPYFLPQVTPGEDFYLGEDFP